MSNLQQPKIAADTTTVGELIAAYLEECGVTRAFGVISIHNMPILDAFGRRGRIRFVPARGEAGAVNMADASARVTGGLGVVVTSTGTAAGNAAGAMVEALTAGTPLLHLTGQIESQYLDRDLAFIHEAPDQLTMLQAVSKAAYRVRSAETALSTVREAVRTAMTAPRGPVGVEIPIDIQGARVAVPSEFKPLKVTSSGCDVAQVQRLAKALRAAKRPLLWLGGGAREAGAAVERLLKLGWVTISSVQGRGIVAEDHSANLGAFNFQAEVEQFYQTCDAMVVAGSRLRGNETLQYKLRLPRPLYRIDIDALADNRAYPNDMFVHGDCTMVLAALADELEKDSQVSPTFVVDARKAHRSAVAKAVHGLGPYSKLVDTLQRLVGRDFSWVRDVTISNSTWGNRLLQIFGPCDGVHALGGGIGQGIPMAIGAAISRPERKTVCLVGDGGLMLNVGELATAVQEKADMTILLMNDRGYGVIKNIQDALYGGRHYFVDLHQPKFAQFCESLQLPHACVSDMKDCEDVLTEALAHRGPYLVEFDMRSIGQFKTTFAGPPLRNS